MIISPPTRGDFYAKRARPKPDSHRPEWGGFLVLLFLTLTTTRGTKHVQELIHAVEAGYEAYVLFVIQMEGIRAFCPHWERDESFSRALVKAQEAGVKILAYDCKVNVESLYLSEKVFSTLERIR